jgi:hypothetical protein
VLTDESARGETDRHGETNCLYSQICNMLHEVFIFELKLLPYVGTVKELPVKSYYKHRGFQSFVDFNFRPSITMNVVTLAGMRRTPLPRRKYSCYSFFFEAEPYYCRKCDIMWNCTCYIPACSAPSQTTASPPTPPATDPFNWISSKGNIIFINFHIIFYKGHAE